MKLGILGGTFNPPHYGHLLLAENAKKELSLDRVLLMVAADPPHKPVELAAGERFTMACLAVEGETGIEASDLELKRRGKSYTVETLRELHDMLPEAELVLIVGADMLADLPTWREAESIFRLARVAASARPGVPESILAAKERLTRDYSASVTLTEFSGPDISSTAIRTRMENGLPVEGMLPENVELHAYEKGYYFSQTVRAMQENLASALKKNRYEHTAGVMRTAAGLAARYGADPKKAQLAALLHDCAKLADPNKMLSLAEKYRVVPDEFEAKSPGLLHAKLGAVLAREEYGVHDEEILSAIRYHTTGRAGMMLLEKIIYLADMIEPHRSFPGVEPLRELSKADLDAAVRQGMENSIRLVKERGEVLHPRTEEALRYLQTASR